MGFLRRGCYAGVILGGAVTVAGLGGCEAAGFLADALEIGIVVQNMGKAETVVDVPWERAEEAARKVAAKLELKPVKEEPNAEKRKREMLFVDDRGQEVTVTIIRRTATMTEMRVDVSLLGTDAIAELMLKRMMDDMGVTAPGPHRAAPHIWMEDDPSKKPSDRNVD